MSRFRHPGKRALRDWLNGEHDGGVDNHLAGCQRCAATLEEMAGETDYGIGDALAAVYTPPDDLAERLERRVAERLDSRVILDVITDLFGAGIETSKLLLTEDQTDE